MHHAGSKPFHKAMEQFIGRRARFQRLTDGKLFSGWIEACDEERLTLLSTSTACPDRGDDIYLEGCSDLLAVSFQGRVVESIKGPSPRIYVCCNGEIRYGSPHENARRRIKRYPVLVTLESGVPARAFIVDASKHSIGLICDQPIDRNSSVKVSVQGSSAVFHVEGHVLYCVTDRRHDKLYRFGLFVPEMPRLEQQRWERFISELG